eukprot:sb/3467844/
MVSDELINIYKYMCIQLDPDLTAPSGEMVLSVESGCPINRGPLNRVFSLYPFLNGGENQLSKKWFVLPRFTLIISSHQPYQYQVNARAASNTQRAFIRDGLFSTCAKKIIQGLEISRLCNRKPATRMIEETEPSIKYQVSHHIASATYRTLITSVTCSNTHLEFIFKARTMLLLLFNPGQHPMYRGMFILPVNQGSVNRGPTSDPDLMTPSGEPERLLSTKSGFPLNVQISLNSRRTLCLKSLHRADSLFEFFVWSPIWGILRQNVPGDSMSKKSTQGGLFI